MTAAIHVLILQQDRPDIVDHWWEEDDDNYSLNLEKWEQSSSFWPERLLKDDPDPMEVFLCLDREFLAEGYNPPFIRRVVQQAHRSMWNAKVYLVIDKTWQPDLQDPEGPEPFRWTKTVLDARVSDILQWSITSEAKFSEAAWRSRQRMEKLVAQLPHRAWKCLLQRPFALSHEEETLFSSHLVGSLSELQNENCLIVLPEERDDDYIEYLQQMVRQVSDYEIMVGFIDRIVTPPLDLEEFCRKKGHALIHFHGLIELYYFLQRLNSRRLSEMDDSDATPVRVINPIFKSHLPQLLITHSYLSSEKHSCLIAANDTWKITENVRGAARVKIYPAIKCDKLGEILDELGHVLAWIHIGHGDDAEGLQEAEDELFKSAQDWLDSFAGYQSSLALVLFCSCRSAFVAERFAERGAGVAIGFRQDVNKKVCVELTKKVIKAALESNGSRRAILEAFRIGRTRLRPLDPNALPVAFWASH